MANIFVWQVVPNWANGVTETLEWKTDILQSYSGAEQRIARRLSPRRTFEFEVLIAGNDRAGFENRLAFAGANRWYFPIYADVTHLNLAVSKGDTTLSCVTQGRDFVSGGKLLISHDAGHINHYALLDVLNVKRDGITLSQALKSDFSEGAFIYPIRLAQLTDMPTLSRYNSDLLNAQVRLQITEHNAFSQDVSFLPCYRNFPVLNLEPDWSNSLKSSYQRLLLALDNDSGIPVRMDSAKLPFFIQEFKWFLINRDEQIHLRQLFYYLNGCQKTLWVTSQSADLNAISVNGSILDVENTHFADIGLMSGRRDIAIKVTNGCTFFRRIVSVAVISNRCERLLLDAEIDADIESILAISFLTLCRLDSDFVSWEHVTDGDGLANVTCSFRGVRDELESI